MARVYADKIRVYKDPVHGWVAQFFQGSLLAFTISPAADKHADMFTITGIRVTTDNVTPETVAAALKTEVGKAAATVAAALNDGVVELTPELRDAARTLCEAALFQIRNG